METQIKDTSDLQLGEAFCEYFGNGTLHAIYYVREEHILNIVNPDNRIICCECIEIIAGGLRRYNMGTFFPRNEFVYIKVDSNRYFTLLKALCLIQSQLAAYNIKMNQD